MPSSPHARLTFYLASDAQWHHRPVYTEIVHRAHRFGLTGASVFHGQHGYRGIGPLAHFRDEHPWQLVGHGPCMVVLIDREQRLRAFLDQLDDLGEAAGTAALDHVEIHDAPRITR